MKKLLSLLAISLLLVACAPEIGSPKWCEKMKDKPKADWTVTEAKDFTQHCIL
jgi:hypothetical protein